jgi:flagellar basal-body rod protein FlgB
MAISNIPILSMRRTRLQRSQERQRVLAEKVANGDTPSYRARDLVPPKFETPAVGSAGPLVSLARTENGYMAGIGQSGSAFRTERSGDYEVRPTGSAVNPRAGNDESGGEPDRLPPRPGAFARSRKCRCGN